MKNIELLEHGGGHFHVRHRGELIALPDPRTMPYQKVLMVLYLQFVPGTPDEIPWWQIRLVFDRWRAAWDLPEFQSARRLAYLVDNYRSAAAYSLQVDANGSDLGRLWRERRWTLLLDLLDRLPGHSHFNAAVSMDEEHAKMMAESIAARKEAGEADQEPAGPSLTTWSPEVAVLTRIVDQLKGLQHTVVAVQHGKKAGEPPKPEPRPTTPLERAIGLANYEARKKQHEALVARVLPGKSPPPDPVH